VESAKNCSPLKADTSSEILLHHDAAMKPDETSNDAYNMDKIFYDDDIPVVKDECLEVHEMIVHEEMEEDDCKDICLKFKSSPIDRLISPIPHSEYDEIKSPLNTISDCGYESQGSPISLHEFSSVHDPQNDFDLLISDLFPSLGSISEFIQN
jgi:hypothetical protein